MIELALDKLHNQLDELQNRIREKAWRSLNPKGFVFVLNNTINDIEDIMQTLNSIKKEYEREGLTDYPEINEYLEKGKDILNLLKKNRDLEKEKIENLENNDQSIEPQKDLYSSLEQSVLEFLLKTRYLADRLNIYERKRGEHPVLSNPKRTVIELLEKKEGEFSELKKKYEELRSKTHLGLLEEKTVADLEKEFYDEIRKQDVEIKIIVNNINSFEKELEELGNKYKKIRGMLSKMEEISEKQINLASELVKQLKKERDYAKRVLLDIENETLKIRSAYSKELLALEQEKEIAREEAYQKYKTNLGKLRKEIEQKDELIADLRKIIETREEKIKLLNKKIAELEKIQKREEKEIEKLKDQEQKYQKEKKNDD
ncbi:MAG: hypothetical protein N3D73_00545 [Candidatus Diapherotrites archaeon]|nr:hypothetical protein [Candidatus Diapherotrites archaeon]